MSSSTSISANAYSAYLKKMDLDQHDLANANTPGYIPFQVVHSERSNNNRGSGMEVSSMLDINAAQQLSHTNTHGDIAVSGDGWLPVKIPGSATAYYTKTGQFQPNTDSFLEYAGLILQGRAYDATGTLGGEELAGIKIDKSISTNAKATTKVDLDLELDSRAAPSGSTGISLSSFTYDSSKEGKLLTISSVLNTFTEDQDVRLVVGGGIASVSIATTSTSFPDVIQVKIDEGSPITIDLTGLNNALEVLKKISQKINEVGGKDFGAEVVEAGTGVSLAVYSAEKALKISFQDSSGNDFSSSSTELEKLLGSLNGKPILANTNPDIKRFAILPQLKALLPGYQVTELKSPEGVVKSVQVAGRQGEMLSVGGDAALLSELGLKAGESAPLYSAFDSKYNMAGGGAHADHRSTIAIVDSKGNSKNLDLAFKKISKSSWAVEVYARGAGARGDGLLQAGTLNFDELGKLVNITHPQRVLISKAFSSPDADSVPALTLTQGAATAQGDSLRKLAQSINTTAGLDYEASIAAVPGGYALMLVPKSSTSATIADSDLATLELTGNNPNGATLFGSENLTASWNAGATEVANSVVQLGLHSARETALQSHTVQRDNDGKVAGVYDGWRIDENGDVVVTLTNGDAVKVYQVPLAVFKAPQYMQREGGAYVETGKSGQALIVSAGDRHGVIKDESLLESGADGTEALISMLTSQYHGQLNISAMTKSFVLQDALVNKL